jgi:FkbM family methyltransferase
VNQRAFVSHAQNGEDVVLWRALHPVGVGTYVDVGANDPDYWSVTRAFYDRGWRGINIDPMPTYAALLRSRRPEDVNLEVAVSSHEGPVVLHAFDGSGLSTLQDEVTARHDAAGFQHHDIDVPARRLDDILSENLAADADIHFLTIDVEGAERDVLTTVDLSVWRPWVIVVESTAPLSSEQTHSSWEGILEDANYLECLFDGLSRFYCAAERYSEIGARLSYPACILDAFATAEQVEVEAERDKAQAELLHWRATALTKWADTVASDGTMQNGQFLNVIDVLQREIDDLRGSTSWRVTGPLRAAKGAQLRLRAGR